MLVDYHMHLERGPFTRAWLDRFLATARERGVAEIGISEHIYRFREAQEAYGAWWEAPPPRPPNPGGEHEGHSPTSLKASSVAPSLSPPGWGGAGGGVPTARDPAEGWPPPGTAAVARGGWAGRGGPSLGV